MGTALILKTEVYRLPNSDSKWLVQ